MVLPVGEHADSLSAGCPGRWLAFTTREVRTAQPGLCAGAAASLMVLGPVSAAEDSEHRASITPRVSCHPETPPEHLAVNLTRDVCDLEGKLCNFAERGLKKHKFME